MNLCRPTYQEMPTQVKKENVPSMSILPRKPRFTVIIALLFLLVQALALTPPAEASRTMAVAPLGGSRQDVGFDKLDEATPPLLEGEELTKEQTEVLAQEELFGYGSVEGEVLLSTGVTMRYVRQGRPNGPVIIFVPGYTDSHRSFERTLSVIPRRFQVYVLTMRGHGDSSKPVCCYAQSDFVADIAAFMDAKGIQKATLAGHSMGSFIAQLFALTHPERLNGLVLIGSGDSGQLPAVIELNDYVQTLEELDPAFVRDFQASTFYVLLPDAFINLVTTESLKAPLYVWQDALAGMLAQDHRAQLGQISTRTLIISGAQDPYFPVSGAEALDETLPNSYLRVYGQTGHAPHVERPLRFSADLTLFMLLLSSQ